MNKGISKMMKIILMKIKKIFIRLVKLIIRYIYCNNKTESMKLQFYKNIDVVQINIKAGVTEYFLPANVDWADKKIDKMLVYGSNPETGEVSTIDGITPIIDREQVGSAYFDLYDENNVQIGYSVSAINLMHTCNHPFEINSKLGLQTSKIVFTEEPVDDCCILLYVFWDTKTVDSDDVPERSVTVKFPIKNGEELSLSKVIDTYIHSQSKKLKGLSVWGGYGAWNFLFITLRDYNYKTVVKMLPAGMCRPPMGVDPVVETASNFSEKAQSIQVDSMYLDCADIDFDNSFIYQASDSTAVGETDITITFLY